MSAALARAHVPPPDPEDDDRYELTAGQMSFLDHLEELRTRLVRACWAIGIGMLAAFAGIERIADFVLAPARAALPPGAELIYTNPGEGIGFYLEVAMLAGAIIASPAIAYQLWRFVAPGLYAHEKRLVIPFVGLASAGAIGGAAFGHYVLFPSMMVFFGSFHSSHLIFMPRLEDVFRLYTITILGMAIVFQIPTVVFFTARMGVITAGWLWRNLKYAILGIFIIAAVATPSTDPWNQIVFAVPMVGLYLVSIAIAWAVKRRAPREPETKASQM